MKKMAVVLLGVFVVACGGGDGGGPVSLDANQAQTVKTSSTDTVNAGVALNQLKTNAQADEPISKLSQIFANASQLWSTKMQAEYGSGGNPYALNEAFESALTDGCVTESGGTITYNCNDYGYSITGTVTVAGDTITLDLHYTGNGVSFDYAGSVTVTDSSIDGNIGFNYQQNQGGQDFTYEISIGYNGVVLVDGCPTGGSLNVDVNVDVTGMEGVPAGYGAVDYPNVEVRFGPACGDLSMY